jgi:hypothetical protein
MLIMAIKQVTLKTAVTRIKIISNIPDTINLLQNKAFQSFSSHEEAAKSFVLILKIKE